MRGFPLTELLLVQTAIIVRRNTLRRYSSENM